MAMANMNLIGAFVTKLWPVQALACGGSATKNIIPPTFSNFGDIINYSHSLRVTGHNGLCTLLELYICLKCYDNYMYV